MSENLSCNCPCMDCDEDDWDGEEYDYTDLADDDMDDWECAYPDKCLMPSILHTRDECHTVEDMEAYYREMLEQEKDGQR